MRKRIGFNHLMCSSESSATGVSVCPEKEVCSTRAAPTAGCVLLLGAQKLLRLSKEQTRDVGLSHNPKNCSLIGKRTLQELPKNEPFLHYSALTIFSKFKASPVCCALLGVIWIGKLS